jgi:hypothetical protein
MTPDAARATGRLEQTCPRCGRCEAASDYCSYGLRTMSDAGWYPNGTAAERHRRMPAVPPTDVPFEYRKRAHWPGRWGPYPTEAIKQLQARDFAQTKPLQRAAPAGTTPGKSGLPLRAA